MTEEQRWAGRVWLFPATYAVHIAEEYFGGEGFAAWASQRTELHFAPPMFLAINAVAMAAMLAVSWVAASRPAFSWLVTTLGTVVALNGTLHVVTSVVTRSYSPGAVSGLLLWIPLGAWALVRSRRWLELKVFVAAVLLGVLAHGTVTGVAVSASRGAP